MRITEGMMLRYLARPFTAIKYREDKSQSKVEERLCLEQLGHCALCGQLLEETGVLDHDHKTGLIRGLIHFRCNLLLGHFEKELIQEKIG